jgi:solute carrier family 25 carnitine/acylcarnitine transporter 20/29
MQMYRESLYNTVKRIVMKEKLSSFFNGIAFPFVTSPIVSAVAFGTFEAFKRLMITYNYTDPVAHGFYAGLATGVVATFCVTPVEMVKCRLQAQTEAAKIYKNSFQCVKSIIKDSGVRGLYRGTVATLFRELPAESVYFMAYQISKDYFISQYGEFSFTQKIITGGMAGALCWLVAYPQDIIKTRIQCQPIQRIKGVTPLKRQWDGGFLATGKDIWRKQGWGGFWNGLSACLIRATYANACAFVAYEEVRSHLLKGTQRF